MKAIFDYQKKTTINRFKILWVHLYIKNIQYGF